MIMIKDVFLAIVLTAILIGIPVAFVVGVNEIIRIYYEPTPQ